MLRKLLFRSSIVSFKRILPLTPFKAPKLFFSIDNKSNNNVNDSNDESSKNDNDNKKNDDANELNLDNESGTIISNDLKKTKSDFQIKDEIKLETVPLRSRKFSLTEEEKLLPQKTYIFFSSGQSIISKNNQSKHFNHLKI